MERTRLKIFLVGQGRAVPRQLSSLLADAGYEISPARRTPRQKWAAQALAALASEGAVFTAELAAPGRPNGRSTNGRSANGRSTNGRSTNGRSAPHPRQEPRTTPMTLRALRESVGRTQGEIATRVSMTQPQLSRVEARRDHLISTVRRYVQALDGQIEVTAIVNGSRVVLRDV